MDTGIGISKENTKRLFQAYQQANASISRKYGGTGLGLWITKNILKLMNGDISTKSKEGSGSNFILAFPAKVCKEVVTFEAQSGVMDVYEPFKGKTVIILDDNQENTFVTGELLRRHGFTTICKNSGMKALDIYKSKTNIDLIITDLRMPTMSGQSFLLEVRKYEEDTKHVRKVPIIVLTAESATEEKRMCLTKYGANDYLVKPIKYQDLISSIVKLLITDKNEKCDGNSKAQLTKQRKKNILIVDDDIISSKFLLSVFVKAEHSCDLKHSVADANAEFDKNRSKYDAILVDSHLGDGTGAEFIRYAASVVKKENGRLPFIVSVSGNPISDQRMMYQGLEVDEFLQKPVKRQDLLDIIRLI